MREKIQFHTGENPVSYGRKSSFMPMKIHFHQEEKDFTRKTTQ